ncbi:SWIM zinc finger domain-containing protein [Hymenobacter artigasi]|uniref:Zn finger protein n=1 Tax=Hymenobacter artigasi TaxID=2719616 RepID=A0ABX1HLV9_9BACT|nr:SWIM zinc finger family protein [Hymenobacter artigasi]NKI89916.1 putative Zn finger protein [Hymenobacter artigasi]
MFTEADLEALVPQKIFERGSAYYYEDNAVGRISRTGDTFKARVEGTESYRVELTMRSGKPPKIYCDCPYDYGDVCKHGIALGLAVLDWFSGGDEPKPVPEPAPLTKKARRAHLLSAAWTRTSDRERLAFLQQLLLQKPKVLRRFLKAFEFDEKALTALPTPVVYVAKPRQPLPAWRPSSRRTLTLTEQAQQLIDQQRGPELLPLVLSLHWLQNPPAHDSHTLPHLLHEAARFQPEATFDAAMERFETLLEDKALRTHLLYNRLTTCLKSLATLPALTQQVHQFASELMQQYSRLSALKNALRAVGFAPLPNERDTGLPPKKRGRQPKNPAR